MAGLIDLFANMVGRGNELTRAAADEPMETVSSTVRFGGDLRRFLESQATAGGISVQAVITAALNSVMHETLGNDPRTKVDIVPRRLLELFDRHGIDFITAAEILRIPFADMKPDRLVNHINNDLLDWVCDTFAVPRSSFLTHRPMGSRKVLSWDRYPSTAAERILEHARNGLHPRVVFLKKESWDLNKGRTSGGNGQRLPVILELTRSTRAGKKEGDNIGREYKTYEAFEALPWEYERCRIDILTLVMFCVNMYSEKHEIVAQKIGRESNHFLPWGSGFTWTDLSLDDATFDRYTQGEILPSEALAEASMTFAIDDFIDDPKVYPNTTKANPDELRHVVEKYDATIKYLADSIDREMKRKENVALAD